MAVRTKVNAGFLVAVAGVITYFSTVSLNSAGAPSGTFSFLHLAAYFGLGAAFLLYFHDTRRGHLEAVAAAGVFGLGIELVQSTIPYRSFSFEDIAVNFLGASIVLLDHRIGAVSKAIEVEDKILEEFFE
ncbi:VanZ family protein [Candidatus Nanohalococcus occultus]|uniref:VanZ family protein n=1 Tax=Candidatus Nanohalococcus occultus TaxID=2978047 RepID=UPI0039DF3F2F